MNRVELNSYSDAAKAVWAADEIISSLCCGSSTVSAHFLAFTTKAADVFATALARARSISCVSSPSPIVFNNALEASPTRPAALSRLCRG